MKFNILEKIRESLLDLKPYSSARDEFNGNATVFVDANENPNNNGVNRYPDPLQIKLKERISEIQQVSVASIFLGNGSDEVIDLCFRLFCEPSEDIALSISPSYGMYGVSAKINNVELKKFNLNTDFTLNVPGFIEAAKDAKMVFLCSPNNPTGNAFDLPTVTEICNKFSGLVIVDEAYIDFSPVKSAISLIEEFPNLLVCQTFSKAYGMAAIRLGKAFGNPTLISWLNKIKPPYNINQLTIDFALNALKDLSKIESQKQEILSERNRLVQAFTGISIIEKIYPSDANFILVKVKDANKTYNELTSKGIVVRNRTNEPLCENCLRITVGTPEENNKIISFFHA